MAGTQKRPIASEIATEKGAFGDNEEHWNWLAVAYTWIRVFKLTANERRDNMASSIEEEELEKSVFDLSIGESVAYL